jgi:hypothetical protein
MRGKRERDYCWKLRLHCCFGHHAFGRKKSQASQPVQAEEGCLRQAEMGDYPALASHSMDAGRKESRLVLGLQRPVARTASELWGSKSDQA